MQRTAQVLLDTYMAWLRCAVARASYRNFAWDVSWLVTRACNLHCEYCGGGTRSVGEDIRTALSRVIAFNPRNVALAGGEIFLVPGIADALRELREKCPHARICVATNLCMDVEEIAAAIPFVDVLIVSVDSYGEWNRIHRHVDGTLIMEKLARLRDLAARRGIRTRFITNSVVTVKNYSHLPGFVRQMQEMIPGQEMGFTTVNPYAHPLSLGSHAKEAREVIGHIRRLQAERVPVWFSDLALIPEHADGRGRRVKDEEGAVMELPPEVICKRQYFRTQVLPDGGVVSCKPGVYLDAYYRRATSAIGRGRYGEALRLAWRLVDTLLIRRHDPRCACPCNCEYFMEGLFSGLGNPEEVESIRLFGGKFAKAEVEEAERFLLRHYGVGFPERVRGALCRPSENRDLGPREV